MQKKGKIVKIVLMLVFISGFLFIQSGVVNAKKKTVLNNGNVWVEKGDKVKLSLKDSVKNNKLVWRSSDSQIASVTKSGKIKAKKEGTVTIKASDSYKEYNWKVMVVKKEKKGNSVFTKEMFQAVKKIECPVKGYTVTSSEGIYRIYSLLSKQKLMPVPDDTPILCGGLTLKITKKNGKTYLLVVASQIICEETGTRYYPNSDGVAQKVLNVMKKYKK